MPRDARPPLNSRIGVAFVCFIVALSIVPADSAAQMRRRGVTRDVIAACAGDYAKYCDGVAPGRGRIVACLNDNAEKLSQQCFSALAKQGLAMASVLRICRSDYEKQCGAAPRGLSWGIACLVEKRATLSNECRALIEAHGFSEDEVEPARPRGPDIERAPGPAR